VTCAVIYPGTTKVSVNHRCVTICFQRSWRLLMMSNLRRHTPPNRRGLGATLHSVQATGMTAVHPGSFQTNRKLHHNMTPIER